MALHRKQIKQATSLSTNYNNILLVQYSSFCAAISKPLLWAKQDYMNSKII